MSALIKLAEKVKAGYDIGITPDGPRGPLYQMHPGALKLAQLTGARIMTVRINYESYWEFGTWDRFQLPKPFSKLRITLDSPVAIPRKVDEAQFESTRVDLEGALNRASS